MAADYVSVVCRRTTRTLFDQVANSPQALWCVSPVPMGLHLHTTCTLATLCGSDSHSTGVVS